MAVDFLLNSRAWDTMWSSSWPWVSRRWRLPWSWSRSTIWALMTSLTWSTTWRQTQRTTTSADFSGLKSTRTICPCTVLKTSSLASTTCYSNLSGSCWRKIRYTRRKVSGIGTGWWTKCRDLKSSMQSDRSLTIADMTHSLRTSLNLFPRERFLHCRNPSSARLSATRAKSHSFTNSWANPTLASTVNGAQPWPCSTSPVQLSFSWVAKTKPSSLT